MLKVKIVQGALVTEHFIETPKQTPEEFIQDMIDVTPTVKWNHGPMNLISTGTGNTYEQVEVSEVKPQSHYAVGKKIVDFVTPKQ